MKKLLLSLVLLAGAATSQAQKLTDPAHWNCEIKKVSGYQYKLTYHLKLDDKWHAYAMDPGGDGSLLPIVFTVKPTAGVKLEGKPVANCAPITKAFEGIDGAVHYYTGNVDFTQMVTVTKPTTITGNVGYQTCNDNTCLPPKKFTFSVVAK